MLRASVETREARGNTTRAREASVLLRGAGEPRAHEPTEQKYLLFNADDTVNMGKVR